jgi:hypothetical protein
MRPRKRSPVDRLIVRDDECAGVLGVGRDKWAELKREYRDVLDIVQLGPNSSGPTTDSLRKLVAMLPRKAD